MQVEGRKFDPPYITCELTPIDCQIIGLCNDRVVANIDKPGSKPAFQLIIIKNNTYEYTRWITDGDVIWGISLRYGAPTANRYVITPPGPIPPRKLVQSMIKSYLSGQLTQPI